MSQKKCVTPTESCMDIKKGKSYEVISESASTYTFIDDDGCYRTWDKERLKEHNKQQNEAIKVLLLIAALIVIAILSSCTKEPLGVTRVSNAQGNVVVNYDHFAIDMYYGKVIALRNYDYSSISVNCDGECAYVLNGEVKSSSVVVK